MRIHSVPVTFNTGFKPTEAVPLVPASSQFHELPNISFTIDKFDNCILSTARRIS